MTSQNHTDHSETTLTQDLLYAIRYYLGSRRGLLILAAIAVVAGLALNWSWLVAAGIAPILLGALPCVAMCALGLCMHRAGSKSCSAKSGGPKDAQVSVTPDVPPTARLTDDRRHDASSEKQASDHD